MNKRPEGDSDVFRSICSFLRSSLSSANCASGRNFCLVFIQVVFLFYSTLGFGLTTETLPTNIYSPAFRYGQISGLDEHYSESGTLQKLKDLKSIEFDAETLSQFNSKANELISTLNKFGVYKAGDLFNLGTLEIDTKPEIKYFAAILAKGISESWTIGVGLPVIKYSNQIQLTQKFSNMDYYNQFRGLSPELDQALDTDLTVETQTALSNKGYKPLESTEKQFLGDIQLVSLKKMIQTTNSRLLHLLTLTLPTGPAYDTDDLVALNSFHEFSIENKFIFSRQLAYFLEIAPTLSAKYVLPEKLTIRVPQNQDDMLPDQNSKDELTKNAGLLFEAGLNISIAASEQLKFSTGYNISEKYRDQFSPSSKGNSELLSIDTNSKSQKINAEISYSTIQSYLKTKKYLPFILSFAVFDTIAGENIERRLGQELNMTLFF